MDSIAQTVKPSAKLSPPKQTTSPISALSQACDAAEDTLNDIEFASTALETIKLIAGQLIDDATISIPLRIKLCLLKDNAVLADYFTSKASEELDFIRADWASLVEESKAGAA